tara:strand:+ start:201 stop:563 length:363 start_codon:yes stop_codon:yes gene_type:complete
MSFYLDDDIFKKILQIRSIEMKKDLQTKQNKLKHNNVINELNELKSDMNEFYGYSDYEKYDCYEDETMTEFYDCGISHNYYMSYKISKIDPDYPDSLLDDDYRRPHHTIFKYMLYMNLCL